MSDTIKMPQGVVGAKFSDIITLNGRPFDLTGAAMWFRMRRAEEGTLFIDDQMNTSSPQPLKGEVVYACQAPSVAERGEFKAWWRIDPPGVQDAFETPEFDVHIFAHAPGEEANHGAIARMTRAVIPNTWVALSRAENYGDVMLQDMIELTKAEVLSVSVTPANEAGLHIKVREYIAKLTALSLIPTAIDYYKDIRVSIRGREETATFPARIESLEKLETRLRAQVIALKPIVQDILGPDSAIRARVSAPTVRSSRQVTPDPGRFPREFDDIWARQN